MARLRFVPIVALVLGLVALARDGTAGSGAFRTCDVFNGQRGHCGPWYQGSTVALRDGAYRRCDVFNGQITSCGPWYQGSTVAFRDGAYRRCDVFNGQITSCGPWYQGEAVLWVP